VSIKTLRYANRGREKGVGKREKGVGKREKGIGSRELGDRGMGE
jgi:hypothetical protein